ncbi:hypothetical protein BC831DRAFT_455489 [Entophlyctis helioformis]|nr:hypothetical protein BC831DRAFT_455489 [Entophlyctis helioformis]
MPAMGLEDTIVAATSETNTSDDWAAIINICERADMSDAMAREAVAILTRRILHKNVNVILFSLTVANSLVQNCGLAVKREVSSRAFLDALVRQVNNKASVHVTVRNRILELIQQWADAFKAEPSLDYMVQVYNKLKADGFQFSSPAHDKPKTEKRSSDKDREEEELQLALALSLSVQESKSQNSQPKSGQAVKPAHVLFHVRALYDFTGTEQGELHLARGDIVDVYDCTTFQDWWKGSLRGVVGIFPANYVERIMDGTPTAASTAAAAAEDPTERVLSQRSLIAEFRERVAHADPRSADYAETERLQNDYHKLLELRPEVIKLASSQRQKQGKLTAISERFAKACASYHSLMEAHAQYQHAAASAAAAAAAASAYAAPPQHQQPAYGYAPQQQQQQPQYMPPQQAYYGAPPPATTAGYAPAPMPQQPTGYADPNVYAQQPPPQQYQQPPPQQQQQPPYQQQSYAPAGY